MSKKVTDESCYFRGKDMPQFDVTIIKKLSNIIEYILCPYIYIYI